MMMVLVNLITRNVFRKSYHSDIKYHMTLNTQSSAPILVLQGKSKQTSILEGSEVFDPELDMLQCIQTHITS
jgi:hypothetical protein